jgi:hypothetical protein
MILQWNELHLTPRNPLKFSFMACGNLLLEHSSNLELSWKTTSTHSTTVTSTYFKVTWIKHRTVPQYTRFLSHSIPIIASSFSKVTWLISSYLRNCVKLACLRLFQIRSTCLNVSRITSTFLWLPRLTWRYYKAFEPNKTNISISDVWIRQNTILFTAYNLEGQKWEAPVLEIITHTRTCSKL